MINASLNPGQIAFIVIVPLLVITVVVLLIVFFFKGKNMKDKYKYYYYKKLYKIALNNDYYLINDFVFKIDDFHISRIDHILFGDKYIYIINDAYFDGDITGKETDPSLIIVDKLGKKRYADNPLALNKKLLNRLSLITGINQSLMIGVVIVNDDSQIGISMSSPRFNLVNSKQVKSLVKQFEDSQIGDINQEQLAAAVKAIDKLNKKKKLNNGK